MKVPLGAVSMLSGLCAALAASAVMAQPVGDLHPSYIFAPTGETMAYRLYVPATYDWTKPAGLVVVLHGSNNDENSIFDKNGGAQLKQIADRHGYIVMVPRGYNAFGGYGNIYPVVVTRETAQAGAGFAAKAAAGAAPVRPPPGPPPSVSAFAVPIDDYAEQAAAELTDARINQLSEQEFLAALSDVRRAYAIDASRMYLMGNSMGGIGATYLAAKYPTLWAAVAPSGGPVAAWSYPYERLRDSKVSIMFVHGELDEHANPHWSQVLADAARAQGVDAQFVLVKGGHHGDGWIPALPQVFQFFEGRHRDPPKSQSHD